MSSAVNMAVDVDMVVVSSVAILSMSSAVGTLILALILASIS